MKIYTKTGDDGTTGLVGGSRVKKNDPRIEAYGTVDELNSWMGLLRSLAAENTVKELLVEIQNKLFNIGSRLASDSRGEAFTANLAILITDVEKIEKFIDFMETGLEELNHFVLPGGDIEVSYSHIARTVCRRAERQISVFAGIQPVDEYTIQYINRLSDFLFIYARFISHQKGIEELAWKK
jgi:cob(I)alamin adenosyltransferase